MMPAFYSVKDTAKYLGVPVSQCYTLVRSKGFPVKRVGRHYLVHIESLKAWSTDFTGC